MTASLLGSVFNFVANVLDPTRNQQPDGGQTTPLAGRHSEFLMSRIHTESYISRSRGNGFVASFGGAGGVALDTTGQTTGLAVLFNPSGSGVYVDLERIQFTTASTATQVIAGYALEGSLQTPSGTLTSATVNSFPLGGAKGSPQAKAYTTPTITAMSFICGLGLSATATTSTSSPAVCDFGGKMILAPGFAVNVISTIDQATAIVAIDMFWSEWLI